MLLRGKLTQQLPEGVRVVDDSDWPRDILTMRLPLYAAATPRENLSCGADDGLEFAPPTRGLQLGLARTGSDNPELVILSVGAGPLKDWTMREGLRIQPGDRIARVGDRADVDGMLAELAAPTGAVAELEVWQRPLRESREATEFAIPIGPGDRLLAALGPAPAPPTAAEARRRTDAIALPEASPFLDGLPPGLRPRAAAAALPRWLPRDALGSRLAEAVLDLGMSDALELLSDIGASGEPGEDGAGAPADVGQALLLAAGGGGAAVWDALLQGSAKGFETGSRGELLLWRGALLSVGDAALKRERETLAILAEGWSNDAMRDDWEVQLEEVDEAIGWCAQQMDMVHRTGRGPADRRASRYTGAAAWPPPPAAVLEPQALRAMRELEQLRRARAREGGQTARSRPEEAKPAPGRRFEGGLLPLCCWQQGAEQGPPAAAARGDGRTARQLRPLSNTERLPLRPCKVPVQCPAKSPRRSLRLRELRVG